MAENQREFDRVVRLDAARLADRLAAEAGVRLEVEGLSSGGQVGAAYVRWPDGHRSVLTYVPAAALTRSRETARNLEFVLRAGVPAPRYELVVDLGDEVAIVQELMPGHPPSRVDVDLIEQMLEINHRLYGVLAGIPDIAAVPLYLTESGPGFHLHEPLQSYSDRSCRLLGWIREVGRSVPPTMVGDDLVHVDYHPGNVLVDDSGTISAVVDWNGTARGDARFAIVVMRFSGPPGQLAPDVVARIDRALDEELTPDELRPYWAALSLRLVDWSIRHFSAPDTERWLDLAESRIS
ncbi:MAG TPA: phosphotransferase [Mycobacteriales bacterium]|nr:phosphotransferase [Mycobacteriales bacterium]